MTKEEIGAKLKAKRISCGMTQQEVAEKIGRKQPIVGHWETGYSQPDANTLFLLCDIYGTTVDDVFGFQKNNDISITEYDHIKKYRSLDDFGKERIDYELQKECERIQEIEKLKKKSERIKELESENISDNIHNADIRLINYYYRLASAGTGQIVFDMPPTDKIEIPDIPEYKKVDYAIGVNGNSMEPEFSNGDILLIEMTEDIDIGEIGIFIVDNESYVKKLGNGELISLNPDYENIPLTEDSKCMGKVVDKL